LTSSWFFLSTLTVMQFEVTYAKWGEIVVQILMRMARYFGKYEINPRLFHYVFLTVDYTKRRRIFRIVAGMQP